MQTIEVLPAQSQNDVFSPEDQAILNENRRLRKILISRLTQGDVIPEDKSDKVLLVNLMNGIDSEVLNRAKIKVASKIEEGMSDVRSIVAQALLQQSSHRSRTINKNDFNPPPGIESKTIVPGETEIGVINLTMNDIEEN